MCKHCCRMEWTPCAPIPYACPLCPVREVTDLCHRSNRRDFRQLSKRKQLPVKHRELCQDISQLYCHVVEAKRNTKRSRRRGGADNLLEPKAATSGQQKRVKIQATPSDMVPSSTYSCLDDTNPMVYRNSVKSDVPWTWNAPYAMPAKVLPVQARMAETGTGLNRRMRPLRRL